MPVYEYQGERVEAVQWAKCDDHAYTRQLQPGEFVKDVPDAAERLRCAALDQPLEAPRLVRPGDMIVSRPLPHGELACEVLPAAEFLAAATFVGVPSAALRAGMPATPEHAERRERAVQADLDRQVARREESKKEAAERAVAIEEEARRNPPVPPVPETSGQPGSPQAATRGVPGEDRVPERAKAEDPAEEPEAKPAPATKPSSPASDRREATPQRAGADGNRSTKPDQPDPDVHRARHGKGGGKHKG